MPRATSKTKKKRANGEGTFYKQGNGWIYQFSLGRKDDGTLHRKSFVGATKTVCLERKDAYLKSLELQKTMAQEDQQQRLQEALKPPVVLFTDAFMDWIQLYKAPPATKPTTYGSYLDTFRIHLCPHFGGMDLRDITSDEVQFYYQMKQKNGARLDGRSGGLSAKTIRNHHMLLKDFFSYAKKRYKLECNPTEDTKRPEVVTAPRRVLAPEEMQIFIQEVMMETQRVAILFSLFTGLRIGELLSLRITDLNLSKQSFTVERNLTRVRTDAISFDNPNIEILNFKPKNKTQLIIQNTPKTKTSCREIPMSDALCDLVVRHVFFLKQSGWPNPLDLLFPSKKGTHLDPKSFEIRLNAVSKRCQMKKVNPHALRHTFATRLVDENVPLVTIKNILGHASIQTTQIYTHGNIEVERDAITGITNFLDVQAVVTAPSLNGTKKRMKFADIELPLSTT
ncbi:tyrosine-type recombinase/integrase [Bengtsoniella intestinalis]|uniref:tyrosine-type recombinase/integrase n=1 Tax=Bengtsoniella intestinalis TaxID=3073143 RepID=UPI00391F57F8